MAVVTVFVALGFEDGTWRQEELEVTWAGNRQTVYENAEGIAQEKWGDLPKLEFINAYHIETDSYN